VGSEHDDDVGALKARIATLEAQLAREREAARRHQDAVVRVARMIPGPGEVGLRELLADLAEVAATTLQVDRASVWILSADATHLECVELFERPSRTHSGGTVLAASDYPRYFAALASGRALDADDARTDPRTSEFTANYLVPLGITAMLDAAIRREGRVIGVVCHEHVGTSRQFTGDEIAFAGALADQVAIALATVEHRRLREDAESARRELRITQELSTIDDLTQLYNRREMERLLAADMNHAERHGRQLSVAMIDIDHFKQVNDRYGHPVGDEVLRQVARLMVTTLRSSDRPARYGGEEFLLILPDTAGDDLEALLERLRRCCEGHVFAVRHGGRTLELRLTISMGTATFPTSGTTVEALIEASDRALYRAKHAGRNRIEHAA
jgi:diguanylate cyclase (GGDEF)-like protein